MTAKMFPDLGELPEFRQRPTDNRHVSEVTGTQSAGRTPPARPAAEPAEPGKPQVGGGHAMRDAPLASKAVLLVLTALGVGFLLGLARPAFGGSVWPVLGGAALASLGLAAAAQGWLARPVEALGRQSQRLANSSHVDQLKQLPTNRGDEVGQLARAVHSLAAASHQREREATRLRRTLDDRIKQATRRQTNHLQQIALRDELTGLANRRCLDQRLPELITEAREDNSSLLCLMMDMDNFKAVNDTLGHAKGDELLRMLGQLVQGSIRDADLAVRLGGDEFAILMPGATQERGEQLTDSLRHLLRQHMATAMPEAPEVNLSAGLALLGQSQCCDPQSLVACADHRLYKAKRAGKGCTAKAGTDSPTDDTASFNQNVRHAEQPLTAAPAEPRANRPSDQTSEPPANEAEVYPTMNQPKGGRPSNRPR